jgi:hypothetical protein
MGALASVQIEALLALSSIVERTDAGFLPFLGTMIPFAISALQCKENEDAFKIALVVIGDMARAVGSHMAVYVDTILPLLFSALGVRAATVFKRCYFAYVKWIFLTTPPPPPTQDDDVDRSLKPVVLSAFGDLTLAAGEYFQQHIPIIMSALGSASLYCAHPCSADDDDDWVEFVNQLREGVINAFVVHEQMRVFPPVSLCVFLFTLSVFPVVFRYVGIIQGFKNKPAVLADCMQHIPSILGFLEQIYGDEFLSDDNLRYILGFIGFGAVLCSGKCGGSLSRLLAPTTLVIWPKRIVLSLHPISGGDSLSK